MAQGGAEGLQATQLAILETLERIQEGQKSRTNTARHDTLEDILAGLALSRSAGVAPSWFGCLKHPMEYGFVRTASSEVWQ
eukprot:259215-Amphidinium_carterae.1